MFLFWRNLYCRDKANLLFDSIFDKSFCINFLLLHFWFMKFDWTNMFDDMVLLSRIKVIIHHWRINGRPTKIKSIFWAKNGLGLFCKIKIFLCVILSMLHLSRFSFWTKLFSQTIGVKYYGSIRIYNRAIIDFHKNLSLFQIVK